MSIELTWINRTLDADKIEIFRSPDPFTAYTLPEKIAEVSGTVKSYVDPDPKKDDVFYYMLKTYRGTEYKFSELFRAEGVPYTGPGRQRLTSGDMEIGFFDVVPGSDFITHPELASICNMSNTGTYMPPIGAYENSWLKFAYRGKILFFSTNDIRANVSWGHLYDKGLVFGVSGPGPVSDGITPVDQNVRVNIKNEEFIVRLPTIVGDEGSAPSLSIKSSSYVNSETYGMHGSEFLELIIAVLAPIPSALGSIPRVDLGDLARSAFNARAYTFHCQNFRGPNNYVAYAGSKYTVVGEVGRGYAGPMKWPVDGSLFSLSQAWRPMLEWVPK